LRPGFFRRAMYSVGLSVRKRIAEPLSPKSKGQQ
jgi:hypothetical protein